MILLGPVKVGDVLLVFVPGYSLQIGWGAQTVTDSLGNLFTEYQGVNWMNGNTAFSDNAFYSVVTTGGSGDSLIVGFTSTAQRSDPVVMDVAGTNLAVFSGNAASCASSCTPSISMSSSSLPNGPYFAAAEAYGGSGGEVNAGSGWTPMPTVAYYMTAEYITGTATSTERWVFPGASTSVSFTTCASGTCAEEDQSYYDQLSQAVSFSIIGGGSPSQTISLTSLQLGVVTLTPLTTSVTTVWIDFGSTASVPGRVLGSATGEDWSAQAGGGSWAITSANAIQNPIPFYHRYEIKLSYSVKDGGKPTAPSVTATSSGEPFTAPLLPKPEVYYFDAGTIWSVPGVLSPSATHRWETNDPTSVTVSAAKTVVINYYQQWFVALSYSVSGGGTGYSGTPSLTGSLYGVKQSPIPLSSVPTSEWLDAAAWTVSPNPLQGSSSIERWFATPGTISSAALDVAFYHQYYVTLASAPTGAGSVPAAGWYNANAPESVKATPAAGWKFESWAASSGITISNPSSAATQMTVTATGIVTATFVQNVALSLSKTSLTIAPGASAPVTATIKGSPQSVTLSFSSTNPGISAAFAVNPLTDRVSGVTDSVTISVGSGVAAGTYHITIIATGADGVVSSVSVKVTVS